MAFTAVAACVLVLRYVPPEGVPLPSSSQAWTDTDDRRAETENFLVNAIESSDSPLLGDETARGTKMCLITYMILGMVQSFTAFHLHVRNSKFCTSF